MQMIEVARLIDALRSAGWTEKQINDLFMYVESGKEEFKPFVKKEDQTD